MYFDSPCTYEIDIQIYIKKVYKGYYTADKAVCVAVTYGCLGDDYKKPESGIEYVELALSGCQHLCNTIHDITCTSILHFPQVGLDSIGT